MDGRREDVVRRLAHVDVVVGVAPSPARLAITSLMFMFEEVPEPVWKTSIGNWSSCSPAAMVSPSARALCPDRRRVVSQLSVDALGRGRLEGVPAQRITGHGDRLSGDRGSYLSKISPELRLDCRHPSSSAPHCNFQAITSGRGRRGRAAATVSAMPDAVGNRASHYAGSTCLVTGGLGFIGSNLALALAEAGASVTVVDSLEPRHGGDRDNVAGAEIEVVDRRHRERDAVAAPARGCRLRLQPRGPGLPPRLDDRPAARPRHQRSQPARLPRARAARSTRGQHRLCLDAPGLRAPADGPGRREPSARSRRRQRRLEARGGPPPPPLSPRPRDSRERAAAFERLRPAPAARRRSPGLPARIRAPARSRASRSRSSATARSAATASTSTTP